MLSNQNSILQHKKKILEFSFQNDLYFIRNPLDIMQLTGHYYLHVRVAAI